MENLILAISPRNAQLSKGPQGFREAWFFCVWGGGVSPPQKKIGYSPPPYPIKILPSKVPLFIQIMMFNRNVLDSPPQKKRKPPGNPAPPTTYLQGHGDHLGTWLVWISFYRTPTMKGGKPKWMVQVQVMPHTYRYYQRWACCKASPESNITYCNLIFQEYHRVIHEIWFHDLLPRSLH